MKSFTWLVILSLFKTNAFSQNQYLTWTKGTRIQWSDFRGKAERSSPYAAMSAVGIRFKYHSVSKGKTSQVKFVINATFDRGKSWSKQKLRAPAILIHEQLHFDIAELAGREFKKAAENRIYTNNYKDEIDALFDRYSRQLQRLQEKYDFQTRHSNDKVKQKEWENLIHRELLR